MGKRYLNTTQIAYNPLTTCLYCWDERFDARVLMVNTDSGVTMKRLSSINLDLTYAGNPAKGTLAIGGYWLYNIYRIAYPEQTVVQLINGSMPDSVLNTMSDTFYAHYWCTDDNYIYLVESGVLGTQTPAKIHRWDVLNGAETVFTGNPAYFDVPGEDHNDECYTGPIVTDGTTLWWLSTNQVTPNIFAHTTWTTIDVATMTATARTGTGVFIRNTSPGAHLGKDAAHLYWWHDPTNTQSDQWHIANLALAPTYSSPSLAVDADFKLDDSTRYEVYTDGGQNNIRSLQTSDMTEVAHWHNVLPKGEGMMTDGTNVFWNGVGSVYRNKVGATQSLLSDFSRVDSIW
jgi:hypothetical protein